MVRGAPSLIFDIVVPDDRSALDEPAFEASELLVAGKRLRVRERAGKRELVREHPTGWIEHIAIVGDRGQVVYTNTFAIHVERYESMGASGLHARIVGADGTPCGWGLPSWIVDGEPWRVHVLARARVVAFASPNRLALVTYETLAGLHQARGRVVKLRAAVPGTSGDGHALVTRGGASGAVVEGAGGRRIMLNKQRVAVAAGDRLAVTIVDGVYALVNTAGEIVAREDKIEMVRSVDARAERLPNHDVQLDARPSPGEHARALVTPRIRKTAEQLHSLGIAPALDRGALDDAIADAFGHAHVMHSTQLAAANLLYEHFRAHPPPNDRALLGPDAVMRAAQAGVGWHLVMMFDYEPFALRLTPDEHAQITGDKLLALEPVPPYVAPPDDAAAVRTALLELLGCAPADITHRPHAERVILRLSIRAAALLEQRLPYRDR